MGLDVDEAGEMLIDPAEQKIERGNRSPTRSFCRFRKLAAYEPCQNSPLDEKPNGAVPFDCSRLAGLDNSKPHSGHRKPQQMWVTGPLSRAAIEYVDQTLTRLPLIVPSELLIQPVCPPG